MIGQTKREVNSMRLVDEGWWLSVLTDAGRMKPAAQALSVHRMNLTMKLT